MIENKNYIMEHWNEYNIVDSKEDMLKLLNILDAHGENLDKMHDLYMGNTAFCCQIYFNMGGVSSDRETVSVLFDYHVFFTTYESMIEWYKERAEEMEMTLEDFMEYEDIRKTEDGYVVNIGC